MASDNKIDIKKARIPVISVKPEKDHILFMLKGDKFDYQLQRFASACNTLDVKMLGEKIPDVTAKMLCVNDFIEQLSEVIEIKIEDKFSDLDVPKNMFKPAAFFEMGLESDSEKVVLHEVIIGTMPLKFAEMLRKISDIEDEEKETIRKILDKERGDSSDEDIKNTFDACCMGLCIGEVLDKLNISISSVIANSMFDSLAACVLVSNASKEAQEAVRNPSHGKTLQ